jgi:hypothetical protein
MLRLELRCGAAVGDPHRVPELRAVNDVIGDWLASLQRPAELAEQRGGGTLIHVDAFADQRCAVAVAAPFLARGELIDAPAEQSELERRHITEG